MTRKLSLALTILLTLSASADATPIIYGDFAGSTVMYLDVTETANTLGDEAPLYGPPTLFGDKLDFDPSGFAATATDESVDLTDGQLNFTLMGLPGVAIKSILFSEGGDYSLLGTGGPFTQVIYGIAVASVTVLEVDGVALGVPVNLAFASASGDAALTGMSVVAIPWDLGISYDVHAALTTAGVDFEVGATKIKIAVNNTLGAISTTSTGAFIAKKDFMIDVETEMIPEPTTVLLAIFGLLGTSLCRGIKLKQF